MFSLYKRTSAVGSLTQGLVVVVVAVIAVFNLFFYFLSVQQFQAELQARATDSAVQLAAVLSNPVWNFNSEAINHSAEVYQSLPDVVQLHISDNNGAPLFDYSIPGEIAASATQIIVFEDQEIGQVEISFSPLGIQSAQRDRLFSTVVSTVVVVLAIIVASQVLLRRFVQRPLSEMTAGLSVIGQGNYSHRLPLFNKTDIDAIVSNINDMAVQISNRDVQLRQLVDTLELRVSERTRDLTITEGIARKITTDLNKEELLADVVTITQDAFGLYQVNIFLFDEASQFLTLAAASGSSGDAILKAGLKHHLSGKGLIPSAATEGKAAVSNDVADSAVFLSNPLLPNTRSEAAIPIIFSETLYGVLDLQSEALARFDPGSIELFTSFANQIAIALRNAALFEEAEVSRKRAEESDHVKSAFLATMSHELRTPLNAIINFSKFVGRGLLGPVQPQQEEAMDNVVSSAEHLLALINDVLDISKIEAGSLQLFKEATDLNQLLLMVESTAKSLLHEKPVRFITEIDPHLPIVIADSQRILQVILNITSNACKFTKEGEVHLSVQSKDDTILVTVKDTGPGIAPEEHSAVFEKFKQTAAGLRQGGGTGLGMPISKSLIEAHGGQMWIESEPGHGASFKFTLPISTEKV